METFEEVKGGLKGLLIGEVLDVQKHPNADKLKLTKVKIGNELLQIVCGAPNVAAGQKVIVAPVGTTIYPVNGEPLKMKMAKIRGVESQGMICAEDEIGLGTSHEGIMVLPTEVESGTTAEEYFHPYTDIVYEIGLTPNRMEAMSHLGVARDVCAYIAHHDKVYVRRIVPNPHFKVDKKSLSITVTVEDSSACSRYSGVCISGVQVKESPEWLQKKLKAVGVRPINNIVDITNFVLHETGQPLHAFDYDKITGATIIVKKLDKGTSFITLDEKKRSLNAEDLMICDARSPMCIAGVFGGAESGVTENTTKIFLESAFFDPATIRKTSFRHGLRTDAATRFEKGTDISATVNVAKRAAMLIKQIAGGEIASDIVDVYPNPDTRTEIALKYQYLKKLSGKVYHPDKIKNILESLDYVVVKEGIDAMVLQVPFHKPDVSLQADVVEEILRIDGLDNIEIPSAITITPSVEEHEKNAQLKEKLSVMLTGLGFTEIVTNSLTSSNYLTDAEKSSTVKLLNNLSNELNVMRPSMLHTALEVVSFNINRKNSRLKFFEFGKTYISDGPGNFKEVNHLALYATGSVNDVYWKQKPAAADIYYLKGVAEGVLNAAGVKNFSFDSDTNPLLTDAFTINVSSDRVLSAGVVAKKLADKFDVKQAVLYADFYWDLLLKNSDTTVRFREIPKFPAVERDLAVVVSDSMSYHQINVQLQRLRLDKLKQIKLFDVFESEKLGKGKKSMAMNFTFLDENRTLTDTDIDQWMSKIMTTLEKEVNAEIRSK